ncbi:MAG TPA: gephyrin-like molybdotransferase Glp [Dermatophilaceae bacterium]|nr:gephyrin-like molybdotransferase Glp [Dermatophilaceae bacterium]
MITVGEYLAEILAVMRPLPPRRLPLAQARGCVLAGDVVSRLSLPGFDNSAMDGYAVRSVDVGRAGPDTPVTLRVEGDIPAGDPHRRIVSPGACWRIMTGAPVPDGVDAIVPVEDTDGGARQVQVGAPAPAGAFVRRMGEDVRPGQSCLRAGVRLGPKELALLAAVGQGDVEVVPTPRVLVLSTGDELVEPGAVPGFGQVVDVNGLMLAAAVTDLGGTAVLLPPVSDEQDALLAALHDNLSRVDAVVTSGGVSVGLFDAVKAALSGLGTVRFVSVAMQPGKPQGFGTLGPHHLPVFALPGNPVSSLVSFEVFVAPALRVMAGRPTLEQAPIPARAARAWDSPAGKVQYARVVLSRDEHGYLASPVGGQGSHVVGGLAQADALAVVPLETTRVEAGQGLSCLPLRALPVGTPGSTFAKAWS